MNEDRYPDPLAELPPVCCRYPMDEDMGGWTCLQCGRHYRPYHWEEPDEAVPDAYEPPLVLEPPPPQCPHGRAWADGCAICEGT